MTSTCHMPQSSVRNACKTLSLASSVLLLLLLLLQGVSCQLSKPHTSDDLVMASNKYTQRQAFEDLRQPTDPGYAYSFLQFCMHADPAEPGT